jgi:hypothetical protein
MCCQPLFWQRRVRPDFDDAALLAPYRFPRGNMGLVGLIDRVRLRRSAPSNASGICN